MKNRTTEPMILELKENEIFVFGSNLSGIHGVGAAKAAHMLFGAKFRVGVGLTGQCYAIPTKDADVATTLSIEQIKAHVDAFISYAIANSSKVFLVTEIGCGLAGYSPKEIAPLFKEAYDIPNIHLPESFWNILRY